MIFSPTGANGSLCWQILAVSVGAIPGTMIIWQTTTAATNPIGGVHLQVCQWLEINGGPLQAISLSARWPTSDGTSGGII